MSIILTFIMTIIFGYLFGFIIVTLIDNRLNKINIEKFSNNESEERILIDSKSEESKSEENNLKENNKSKLSKIIYKEPVPTIVQTKTLLLA